MLFGMNGEPQLPVGFRHLVALHDSPYAVELIMGVDGIARVEMREQCLAPGFQRQDRAAGKRFGKPFEWRKTKLNALGRFVFQHCFNFVSGKADFGALRHW